MIPMRRFRVKMRDAVGNVYEAVVMAYNESDAVLLGRQALRKAKDEGNRAARKMGTAVTTMAVPTED